MTDRFLADYWVRRRRLFTAIRAAGQVHIWPHGLRHHVLVPHSIPAFEQGARELSGRWMARAEVWSFPAEALRLVVELAATHYGVTALHVGKEPR